MTQKRRPLGGVLVNAFVYRACACDIKHQLLTDLVTRDAGCSYT